MYGMTAAHKTMKFGTKLRVTNPETGRHVDVIVNDRGPFIPGRDLDLSLGAARAIGHEEKGVGIVQIEFLGRDMRYARRMPYDPSSAASAGDIGFVTIQVGSFIDRENAVRLKQGLQGLYSNVHIITALIGDNEYYRVRVGRFSDYDDAYSIAEKLADEGYSTLITSRK
jgi:rare lipoprotein A